MKIKFIEGTEGRSTGPAGVTLQVLAECDGVQRMVQGFTTEVERDEKAKAVFADVLSGTVVVGPPDPQYGSGWSKEIDAEAVVLP